MPSIGSITGNDPAGYTRFAAWLGRKPEIAHLYFNQMSVEALAGSVPYIVGQAKLFMAEGARILWSVPTPGAGQLEAIVAGTHDPLYRTIAQQIAAATAPAPGHILIRLPWEFNIPGQSNAARSNNGAWNPPLFVKAWQHLVRLFQSVDSRFNFIWCPNAATNGLDPQTCWPGVGYVDFVGQDFYLGKAWGNTPGAFTWFRDEARGLAWGAAFAKSQGKLYALPEWGMDDIQFAGDLTAAGAWMHELGTLLHHHCWWDRQDGGIDCRVSDGAHPQLAAAVRAALKS